MNILEKLVEIIGALIIFWFIGLIVMVIASGTKTILDNFIAMF